jgi:DNA-binding HxlR family transcriptional regulator
MRKSSEAETDCPLASSARILGARWTMEIIYNLRERHRFCELQKKAGGVNPTTLSQRLKFLEEEGLIRRLEISTSPLHVEYELTAAGRALLPALDELTRWAESWLPNGQPVDVEES